MARTARLAVFATGLVALLAACAGRELRAPDPEVVQAHTRGAVSRFSDITVVYTTDRTDVEIGVPSRSGPIAFRPRLAGSYLWQDARTLVFTPRKRWWAAAGTSPGSRRATSSSEFTS